MLTDGLFFNKKLFEVIGSILWNSGIDEKFPFMKLTKATMKNKSKKETEITIRDNKNLFLVFNVIHIRYSVVKFM